MTAFTATTLTPREYAAKIGVTVHQVLGWIHSCQLDAIDVSSRLGTGRPTWKIPFDAICAFESRRSKSAKQSAKPVKRKRRKQEADYIEYF